VRGQPNGGRPRHAVPRRPLVRVYGRRGAWSLRRFLRHGVGSVVVATAIALAVGMPAERGTEGPRPDMGTVGAIEARAVPGSGACGRALADPVPPPSLRAPAER
jgi:hypothetical protein